MRTSINEEIDQFQTEIHQYVRDYQIDPAKIFTINEVGLWNDQVKGSTFENPKTQDNYVISYAENLRDSLFVCLSVTGEVDANWFEHKNQKTRRRN